MSVKLKWTSLIILTETKFIGLANTKEKKALNFHRLLFYRSPFKIFIISIILDERREICHNKKSLYDFYAIIRKII